MTFFLRTSILTVTLALAGHWSATGALAQEVRGRLLGDAARPLGAAYVSLEDSGGSAIASTLTDPSGWFILAASSFGSYTVRAEYIGHESIVRDVVLTPGTSELLELRLEPRALELEGLRVESGRECAVSPDVASRVAAIWEELRKALRVTVLVEEAGLFQFDIDRWTRTLDPTTLGVRDERRRPRSGFHAGSPFASLPAEQLAQEGYVQGERGEAELRYYAPDASVLMSRTFQNTHCFGFTADGPEPGWAGLRFRPHDVAGRDIVGTLWFDRETFAPERLDFDFTRLPWDLEGGGAIGGRVEFAQLPEGPWIVSRWWLRMPVVEERRFRFSRAGEPEVRYGLNSIIEEGGVVREVRTNEERFVVVELGAVEGRVVEEPGDVPVGGARVALRGGLIEAESEADGSFVLDGVPAGHYEVTVTTPSLEAIGAPPPTRTLLVEEERITEAVLRIPAPARAIGALCSEPMSEGGEAVLVGAVSWPDGSPRQDTRLTVEWEGIRWLSPGIDATFEQRDQSASVPVRPDGRFFLCGLEEDQSYRVSAVSRGFFSDTVAVRPGETVERITLPLRPVPMAEALIIRVVGSDGPLPGAQVVLPEVERSATSDAEGRAVFPTVGLGAVSVEVEHAGFAPRAETVQLTDSSVTVVTVPMARPTYELEPVVVEVLSSEQLANRRSGSSGTFALSRADIDAAMTERAVADLGQLLQAAAPGLIYLSTLATGTQYIGSCIVYSRRMSGAVGGGVRCAQVVLDGAWLSTEEAARLLDAFPLSELRSVEFVSPQEATFRFGTAGALSDHANGVVLIRTGGE